MNKKLLLGFWFVLFAVIIITVNRLFDLPLKKVESVNTKMVETEVYLTRLTSLHAEFLYNFSKIDHLFTDHTTDNEKEADDLFNKIENNTELVVQAHFLLRDSVTQRAFVNFSEDYTTFRNNLNDFFLASHELGNEGSGILSQWRNISSQMISAVDAEDEDTYVTINLIKQTESEFLLTREPRLLNEISIMAEDIRNQLMFDEGNIDFNDLDEYLLLTGNIMALTNRIGSTGEEGIIASLEESVHDSMESFNELNDMVLNRVSKMQTFWNLISLGVILLLTAGGVYMIILLSQKSVFIPLGQLEKITGQISRGILPEEIRIQTKIKDIIHIVDHLKSLIGSLREKINFTIGLNKGDFDMKITASGEEDLLGRELNDLKEKIKANTERQSRNEKENEIRRYSNEGLANFSEILRNNSNDIHTLGDIFIKEIVKYLNAIQGGFFMFDDTNKQEPVLNLISAFAYDRKKYYEKTVKLGEGLIGTCAREKQLINMTEIPEGYITITSGLGDTPPDNLLLLPVSHEDELIGVIEIASLNKFKDYEMKLTQDIANNLGSTIVYTRNNQRTSDLLAKSQQQALEMAEQEEEMRQNMEELKATQEESHRREEELKGITDAVTHSFSVVEYDLDGNILFVNEKLCALLEKSREELIGKTHFEAFNASLKPGKEFWDDLINMNHMTINETVTLKDGPLPIKEHLCAVLNRNKSAVKFVNFISDDRAGNS